jgi:hypothetical protein
MSDTNQNLEEAVLRRMLATPPTPHKRKADENASRNPRRSDRPDSGRPGQG